MKAILHYNSSRDQSGIRSRMVAEKLAKEGVEVLFDSDFYGFECAGEKDFETADVLITLGGDGTVLTAAQVAVKYGLPILGINLGNLGYLTAFDYSEADTAVRLLLGGKLETESRAMLETSVGRKTFAALNEICVISVGDGVLPPKVATFSAYSDGEKIDSFRADGLIVSTPTGSTAYSLAAGGPIMEPCVKAILLTSICSHSLHNRPILLRDDAIVGVEIDSASSPCSVVFDGKAMAKVGIGDKIEIKTSAKKLLLLKRADESFYQKLYKKMIRG